MKNCGYLLKRGLVGISSLLALTAMFLARAEAAEFLIRSKQVELALQQEWQVEIIINTEDESINAIEGEIIFPVELLEFKDVNDGNSIINFWIEKLRLVETDKEKKEGIVSFSGITPGGYVGDEGLIFSLIFKVRQEGEGEIKYRAERALLNDGLGTEAMTRTARLYFSAINQPVAPAVKTEDVALPEEFMPSISSEASLFDGKWFIVFSTQDKGSGIKHYEIKETRFRILGALTRFELADSPYILKDQELRSRVLVRAVDKEGNIRVVEIAPRYPLNWYENLENWFILILGTAIIYLVVQLIWRRIK